MTLIWCLADYTLEGYSGDYEIENAQLDEWKEKTWVSIEENGLLPWRYE
jgi:hypothetical protein